MRPNIVLILCDDLGFSDLGCYGGEIDTPNLDALATGGLRYTDVTSSPRCCPSRASLLTGLYPQQADIGDMLGDYGVDGYLGDLAPETVTIAEALRAAGYATFMTGKWHVTRHLYGPTHNWPTNRGFDRFSGILTGGANYFRPQTLLRDDEPVDPPDDPDYYFTDAIAADAVRQIEEHLTAEPERPFFQYVAFTAPHFPLHARPDDIEKYRGRFDAGWDRLREERYARQVELGIVDPAAGGLSERDPAVPPWDEVEDREWQVSRMEVYAAQVDRMDQTVGWIVEALRRGGVLDDTFIVFFSDNGGSGEEIPVRPMWPEWGPGREALATPETRSGMPVRFGNHPSIRPGGEDSYSSYGPGWANLSNTPYRRYKHYAHEGGIATPFIVHWPAGFAARGELRRVAAQLPDIMPTLLDVAGAPRPAERAGRPVPPAEGFSLRPTFDGGPFEREALFWEHHGNAAVRRGDWKLVRLRDQPWELTTSHATGPSGMTSPPSIRASSANSPTCMRRGPLASECSTTPGCSRTSRVARRRPARRRPARSGGRTPIEPAQPNGRPGTTPADALI